MDPLFSPADIEEFRRIWREEFGEELSLERAQTEAEALVRTVHMIFSTAARIERDRQKNANASPGHAGEIRQLEKQMLPNGEHPS